MENVTIKIAEEFGETLGGRWKRLGTFSGELFYENLLEPRFVLAQNEHKKLHIYLDGTKGYGSSFLDQSFGELGRKFGIELVKSIIVFHSTYFKWYVKYIQEEIWGKG